MGAGPSDGGGDALLSVFDRIFVINLAHRDDRRREMNAQLRRIGLSLDHPAVTLFPASFPSDAGSFPSRGARGCFESHLGVHRAIRERNVRRALVLEDDADFVPDFARRIAEIAPALRGGEWNIFYSVAEMPLPAREDDLGGGVLRLKPEYGFQAAQFVGFDRSASVIAVNYLEAMSKRAGGDPEGGPMHVDGAYAWMRRAHPELTAWATQRPLAVQRSSRSDIADLPLWDRLPVVRTMAGMARQMRRAFSRG